MKAATELLQPPVRDGPALIWTTEAVDPEEAQRRGWRVFSLHQLRERFIGPARATGLQRTSLDNPAAALLRLFAPGARIAVVGAVTKTPADLLELYGYVVEPAYRAGAMLLVAADQELSDLDPEQFVEPIGYPWTLERLRYLASLSRLTSTADAGLPPMTPIEAQLLAALRGVGLAPIAQYGVKRFRIDFAFPDVRLAVECDGRPYHDPAADKRRDERLRRLGWRVLHFTGSEIYRDAVSCAQRVLSEVNQLNSRQRSAAPDIVVVERRPWWKRLWQALRRVIGQDRAMPATAEADDESEPTGGPASAWAAGLDPEQRMAVDARDGVVQIIAPAGSGKTTVLVARVRELLARGVPPNRILCLTFNTAAAGELNKRLHQLGIDAVEATTFHALGRRILKEADLLPADVGTLSYGQWRRLAKMAMDQTDDGVWIEAADATKQISDLKLGRMQTVDEFTETAQTPEERTLAALYRMYQAELETQGRCDFDDFIFQGLGLLQGEPGARLVWQQRFTAVLTDEYQDIEPAQELLVQIVAAPEDMLFCVGDEDQCLYAWRRATVERVIELDQVYPGLQRHALARNYRCPSLVVDASRSLITHNRRRFPKRIEAARTETGRITLVAASDIAAQADHAARLVGDLGPTQVVILARTSRVLSEVAVGLARAGVRFFGPERILRQRGEPAVLLAYTRLLGAPERAREEDVEAVFRVPNRYLPDGAAMNVASALRGGHNFGAAIERLQVREPWRAKALAEGAALFDRLRRIQGAPELVHAVRTEGGLDRHYGEAERLNPVDASDLVALERAETQAAGMTVTEYAEALDYEAHIIEQHFDKKGVELATIHGAKGREWSTVIVAGMETDELPHRRSLANTEDPAGELEAERRLAYVAITRAAEHLVLMYARDAPSQFIAEAAPVADRIDLNPPAPVASPDAPFIRPPSVGPARGADRPGPSSPTAEAEPAVVVAVTARNPDGTIPCSLPGCDGWVAAGFVRETDEGFVGLCPRVEAHDDLAAFDSDVDDLLEEMMRLDTVAKREWARAQRGGQPVTLSPGEIVCSLPGCGLAVRADFVLVTNNGPVGLCAVRERHDELVEANPALATQLMALEAIHGQLGPGAERRAEAGAQLLAEGGIPCPVPGCDGVVGVDFIREIDGVQSGICGRRWLHDRLARHDAAARETILRLGRGSQSD